MNKLAKCKALAMDRFNNDWESFVNGWASVMIDFEVRDLMKRNSKYINYRYKEIKQ